MQHGPGASLNAHARVLRGMEVGAVSHKYQAQLDELAALLKTNADNVAQKAGVLWNKVRDHVVSDDNFAETPRPVQDEDDDEKNLKPPSLVYPPDGCIPVLHPDGDVRFYWDLAQMVSLIWVSIFVPLRIGFDLARALGLAVRMCREIYRRSDARTRA